MKLARFPMKRMFLLAALLSSATVLVSCGGGGGEDTTAVAAEDLEVRVDATNGAELFKALESESFVYDDGVPDFGTTTATKVDVVDASATGGGLGFRISSDGNTATGALEFGSCRFRIRQSNYPSPVVVGTVVKVSDCRIRVNAEGLPADGSFKNVSITVTLNGRAATRTVSMQLRTNGTIVIKSVLFGTVRIRQVTGTGSW
jgi:hypothetical protein